GASARQAGQAGGRAVKLSERFDRRYQQAPVATQTAPAAPAEAAPTPADGTPSIAPVERRAVPREGTTATQQVMIETPVQPAEAPTVLSPGLAAAKAEIHADLLRRHAAAIDISNRAGIRRLLTQLTEDHFRNKPPAALVTAADRERLVEMYGPCVTIRKSGREVLTPERTVTTGCSREANLEYLDAAVQTRLNISVSGGTGSGKTTLLNVHSGFIPATERIVTCEHAAELRLRQEHVISLESKPANVEGRGQITIRDLVRIALRMRPDRIIVGEVRGGES